MLKTILFFSFLIFSFVLNNDRIAAIVGERVILESSIKDQVAAFLSNSSSTNLKEDVIRKQVLDYLIEQEVLVYFAKQDSTIKVSPEEASDIVRERLFYFEQQLGSIDALENYFGASYLEIKNTLQTEAENMLLTERLKQKLFSYVSISNSEVEDFYSAYKDSLPLTPKLYNYSCIERLATPSEEALKESKSAALLVFNQIKLGDFSFEDFYSKYSGGDLGFFRRGTFIPEFEVVAFSLKEGEVSPPVLSSLGYHLIRLNKRAGEKIDVSHILFPLSVQESDRSFIYDSLSDIKTGSFSEQKIDSLSGLFSGSCGGVFLGAPKENIPPLVFSSLDKVSSSGFSEVFSVNENSFALVYLKSVRPPSVPDLYEFWGFVEGLALEKKFYSFYDDWYQQNKQKVYIEVK